MPEATLYHELLRPQFHFTAEKNWLNDPNGLVYYKGEYHLFLQYNAKGMKWGPNTWAHAVSTDLVHWKQIAHALDPDEQFGWIWSGSAVVDARNTSGLRSGGEDPLVAIYTTGNTHVTPHKKCVQCIAYSNDRGRSWTKYAGNPVIGHIEAENRDPKVVWHEATKAWIMVLFLDKNTYTLHSSPDLIHWTRLHDIEMPRTGECPDFFELPVVGKPGETRWVFWGGAGVYRIGRFDGKRFVPESDSLPSELGPNGYAAQTWSDIPASDGRRIQISWMRNGKYPYMPFNQQMSFPVELELRSFPEGIRLCRKPVREIALLHDKGTTWKDRTVEPKKNFIPELSGSLFHVRARIEPGTAEAVSFLVHGTDLRYLPKKGALSYLGTEISVGAPGAALDLELLVDRTSLEIFADGGRASASFCFLPEAADAPLELVAVGGAARIASLEVQTLRSIWP